MAKEKEDVLQANAGSPTANIPNLKKKEKERKKAGAAWGGARGAGEFSGATGGNVARAAASAAGAMGEGAGLAGVGAEGAGLLGAESGGFFAGIARFMASIAESLGMGELWASVTEFFAAMTSTLLGKLAVAAAAFLMVAAAGILGYALLKGKGSDGLGSPDLGGISDSMHVRGGGDDRLGVNSKGELLFDPLSAANKPAVAAPTDVKAAAEKPAPDLKGGTGDGADGQKPMASGQLAHNLSGATLSSSMGGEFGGKNIFAGNSGAPKFGGGASNLAKMGGVKGKLGTMKASTAKATPSARSVGKGSANKAFGQLRLAKGLSQIGSGAASGEQAAAAAQGAFDQQQPTGGGLNTIGAPGGDTPPSGGGGGGSGGGGGGGGGGAPDTTLPTAPTAPTGSYTDPGLDSALAQIGSLINQAINDIQTGTEEMILGALLIGIGIGLLFWPMTAVGLALIAAGAALVAMGMSKIAQGKAEAAQAIAEGQALAQSIGNKQQGDAVNYCTQQALANGTSPAACTPPDSVTNVNAETAQDAADVNRVKQIPVGTANIAQ